MALLDGLKQGGAEKMMGMVTPSKLPPVQAAAEIAAHIEHDQAAALNDALDAAGKDERVQHYPDARQQVILSMVDATADQRLAEWWFQQIGVESPEKAAQFAGMTAAQWRDQLRTWHESAHQRGLVENPPGKADPAAIGQTAHQTIQARFGLTLREFVEHVVTFDRGEVVRQTLAAPMETHTQVIRDLTDELRQRNERIEELEAQLQ
jgi:hypothetical protein